MKTILPWFSLKTVPGVGNLIFRRLIGRFGSPEAILSSSTERLCSVKGVSSGIAAAIQRHSVPDWVRFELDAVERKGYRIITLTDPAYPPLLREIPDPPPLLYFYGNAVPWSHHSISIVGSRNATSYGISAAGRISSALAANAITIVSGMARGIDTAAHRGALDGQGKTVAVLGSGFSEIYPPENRDLFHQISENGAVISEFPLKTPPEARNFPVRNRIISGMSLGTVVVEATLRSGSLITARLAAEQNREVFAVPGSIQSFKSSGTHNLIKQGAKLVEQPQDILEELRLETPEKKASPDQSAEQTDGKPSFTEDEYRIFSVLSPYPVHIDEITRKLSIDPGKLSGLLLQMELKGYIQQTPGKFFSSTDNCGE